jgi:hypothetical protein
MNSKRKVLERTTQEKVVLSGKNRKRLPIAEPTNRNDKSQEFGGGRQSLKMATEA